MGEWKTGERGPGRSFRIDYFIALVIIMIILGFVVPPLVARYDNSRRCVQWVQLASKECTMAGCAPRLICTKRE